MTIYDSQKKKNMQILRANLLKQNARYDTCKRLVKFLRINGNKRKDLREAKGFQTQPSESF